MVGFLKKMKLFKGLLTGEVAQTGPFYVTVNLTRRCNLRCLGCRFHSPNVNVPSPSDQAIVDLPYSTFKKLCKELKAMGVNHLILTGEGEPFLHPNISDIIVSVKDAGFHVTLLTNGTLLDKERIKTLIDSRVDILKVSIWAASYEESSQNYTGSNPDNFIKIIDGLKLLVDFKDKHKSTFPTVVLHQPINRYNFQNIDKMVDLVKKTGCNALSFSPLKPYQGRLTTFSLSPEEEKILHRSLIRMRKQLNSLSINHNIDHTLMRYKRGETVWKKLPCYVAWNHARIEVDGMVLPCNNPCDYPMGNINNNKFREIWNDSAFRTFRRKAMSHKRLTFMSKHCDCGFCCHVSDNVCVHSMFRWVSPFVSWLRN
ncbi:MAG: radical SAM protein [Candidatus Anammoxibacter sp.]